MNFREYFFTKARGIPRVAFNWAIMLFLDNEIPFVTCQFDIQIIDNDFIDLLKFQV